ncbi:MAG: hypothetical protein ACPGVO_06065 [Spirulinaceae cyanobacterium]
MRSLKSSTGGHCPPYAVSTAIEVIVDRPFILMILDASTRAPGSEAETRSDRGILFIGRIMNPSKSEAKMSKPEKDCKIDPDFQ